MATFLWSEQVDILFLDNVVPTVIRRPMCDTKNGHVPLFVDCPEAESKAVSMTWGIVSCMYIGIDIADEKFTFSSDPPGLNRFANSICPVQEGLDIVFRELPVREVSASNDQVMR